MRCLYIMEKKNKLSANEAWKLLIEKYDILAKVKKDGFFTIKASSIKEFNEPRLMAKWDSSDSLPKVLRNNEINILPISRSSYVISDFILYQEIPELEQHVTQMDQFDIPEYYESININNINSEASAINVLIIYGILDDFLETKENVLTFNSRMGTGVFDFTVNSYSNNKRKVHVENAQCEIDGGFENEESVIIMEAKNVVREDFHIRQLYYPYRLWERKVKKPIRLVFAIYSNMIYRLFEYKFNSLEDYSSIELVKSKNYSLQDVRITEQDLINVRNRAIVKTDDSKENAKTPFIQADSIDRIISLFENLYENPMSEEAIAKLMDFQPRQSNYYFNAGRYLGLFEKFSEDKQIFVKLTPLGNKIFKLNYKERQLQIVSLILEHKIFFELFNETISTGSLPSLQHIEDKILEFNILNCKNETSHRRAQSVSGWLTWIFNLIKLG